MTASTLSASRVLVVGAGGLGSPALLALARSGIGQILIADDDTVELSNLHRQILYEDEDVGRDKLAAAAKSMVRSGYPASQIELLSTRFLPENCMKLVMKADIVLEGSDNFATKFLAADACHLASRPIVHGAAVRWVSTAWCVGPEGRPCYRCLFEDLLPPDEAPNCSTAGVMGPVVGIAGALMADLALRYLSGTPTLECLYSYDGRRDSLREVPVSPRPQCALCGLDPSIRDTREQRYMAPDCAG